MPDDLTNNNNNSNPFIIRQQLEEALCNGQFEQFQHLLHNAANLYPPPTIPPKPIKASTINYVNSDSLQQYQYCFQQPQQQQEQSTTTQSDYYSLPQPISIADIINWPDSNGLSLLSLVCSSSSHHKIMTEEQRLDMVKLLIDYNGLVDPIIINDDNNNNQTHNNSNQ
jgi:hypothetical protein